MRLITEQQNNSSSNQNQPVNSSNSNSNSAESPQSANQETAENVDLEYWEDRDPTTEPIEDTSSASPYLLSDEVTPSGAASSRNASPYMSLAQFAQIKNPSKNKASPYLLSDEVSSSDTVPDNSDNQVATSASPSDTSDYISPNVYGESTQDSTTPNNNSNTTSSKATKSGANQKLIGTYIPVEDVNQAVPGDDSQARGKEPVRFQSTVVLQEIERGERGGFGKGADMRFWSIGEAKRRVATRYLTKSERRPYRFTIESGVFKDAEGKPLDSSNASNFNKQGAGGLIFVMSRRGKFYAADMVAEYVKGGLNDPDKTSIVAFHHSSFKYGGAVAGAGEIKVQSGELKEMSNASGHYQPGIQETYQVVMEFKNKGVKISNSILLNLVGKNFSEKLGLAEFLEKYKARTTPDQNVEPASNQSNSNSSENSGYSYTKGEADTNSQENSSSNSNEANSNLSDEDRLNQPGTYAIPD